MAPQPRGAEKASSHIPSSPATPFNSSRNRGGPTDDNSFLWLASSYHANPINNVEEFEGDTNQNPPAGPFSTLRTTLGGKVSRTGYQKMPSPITTSPPVQTQPAPSTSRAQRPENHLAPPLEGQEMDASKYRSSWTSTDSDKSEHSKVSISQSDFEFLTPSFIAITNPPPADHDFPAQGRRGRDKKAGEAGANDGLSPPFDRRVTGDSHTLGRLHNVDRESSILPPASVRSGVQSGQLGDQEHRFALPEPSPTTLPLNVTRRPSTRDQEQPKVSSREPQLSPRYYHQPPPLPDPIPQLRHTRSAETTSSADTTGSSRQPLSSAKSHNQQGSGSGPSYPPTAFSSHQIKRKESQSKYSAASGAGYIASASQSPSTSISMSLGGSMMPPPPPGGRDVETPSESIGALFTEGRQRADSEGRHPYANISAYRTAVNDDNDQRAGAGYASGAESPREQHPYAVYQPPPPVASPQRSQSRRPRDAPQRPEDHYSRGSGYTSDGSARGRYVVQGNSAPSSSKPSPKIPYSRSSSNTGHGGGEMSDGGGKERDGRGRLEVLREESRSTNGREISRGVGGSPKTPKKEKRQSAATLLSLRIRNIYPVHRGTAPFSNTVAAPGPSAKFKSGEKGPTSQSSEEADIDSTILRWCGITFVFLLIAAVIPLLGTTYAAVGHVILRAKAEAEAGSLPAGAISDSPYLRASISSSAQAGALGGGLLSIPVLLVVFIAVGTDSLLEFKAAALKNLKFAVSPSLWAQEDPSPINGSQQEKQQSAAERRRSRRASSLWGPNSASISYREQTSLQFFVNILVNIVLAILFLCLGAPCSALGATILVPNAPRFSSSTKVFLPTWTAALSGLVGGAIIFGGTVIIGGVLSWVIYEGGKPIPLSERQLAVGSIPVQGVNVGLSRGNSESEGKGRNANHGAHNQTRSIGESTFFGGRATETGGLGVEEERPPARWI